jgi:tight adherence protein B
VAELLAGLAAELAAGQPTTTALLEAAAGLPTVPCPRAVRAARTGGDVAGALRLDARATHSSGLRSLAACWEVAERSGAGLALAIGRLAEGLRAGDQARAELDSEVAAVRTSARLLAGLPVFGLLVGQWIGAEPLAWLTGTWTGRIVLAAGLALQAAGLLWLHRMVSAVREGL